MRPVAILDATLLIGDGRTMERGGVLFSDGKITGVGENVQASFLARKIVGQGRFVTPGLIDVGGSVALRFQFGGNAATANAADGFDRYAEDEIRAAWRDGVTTVCIPARTGSGVGGVGAVIRLLPRGQVDEVVLKREVALCAGLGLSGWPGPLSRARQAEDLRRRFHAAREYREAQEDYADSLKEYEEKLAERAKQANSGQGKPGAGGVGPGRGTAEQKDEKAAGKNEKKDELKKPAEPAQDRAAEMLLRVLDGELRLWVEAHDPAEVAALLDLAEELNVALVIEGATGAHLLADRLAGLRVPVVLTAAPTPLAYGPGPERYAVAGDAAELRRAGVQVFFGSGRLTGGAPPPAESVSGDSAAAPRLALRAARAAGAGFDADTALAAMTGSAARLLGVERQIGRLEPGLQADLVVWSGHPLAPGACVERVFIAGREVYHAEGAWPEGDE